MTLEVIVKSAVRDRTFFTQDNGVIVSPSGALTLVSDWHMGTDGVRVPVEFSIIAPGLWHEVKAEYHD